MIHKIQIPEKRRLHRKEMEKRNGHRSPLNSSSSLSSMAAAELYKWQQIKQTLHRIFQPTNQAMGFVCFPSSAAALPRSLVTLFQILEIILHGFSAALHLLGLNPAFEPAAGPWGSEELLFSAEPEPLVRAAAASAKNRLPAVEYMQLVRRKGWGEKAGGAPEPAECVVCLEMLEAKDDVRELGNCRHVFHAPCIDRWVDLGQFSCPLCRAALLPAAASGGWMASSLKAAAAGMLCRGSRR